MQGPHPYVIGDEAEDHVGIGGNDDRVSPAEKEERRVREVSLGSRSSREETKGDSPHRVGCVESGSSV